MSSSSLDYSSVNSAFDSSLTQSSNEINNTLQTGDMSDPETLMELQQETAQYTMELTLQSNIIKALGDAEKTIAQNTGS